MDDLQRGQVTGTAAEVYDAFFVPALFEDWTRRMVVAAEIEAGDHVLDVACGTGALTLAAAAQAGPGGAVTGIDVNKGMLAVAARKAAHIDWRRGRAESLPFSDCTFDAVISQFGLMFFEDRSAAVQEMVRVLRPGGRLAVAVWDALANTPGYAAVTQLLRRLFGEQAAESLYAPYCLGDRAQLQNLFAGLELEDLAVTTEPGTARFPSIRAWMYTDVNGWTLAGKLDDHLFEHLVHEAERELQEFVRADGSVRFSAPAHIVTARKS